MLVPDFVWGFTQRKNKCSHTGGSPEVCRLTIRSMVCESQNQTLVWGGTYGNMREHMLQHYEGAKAPRKQNKRLGRRGNGIGSVFLLKL